MFLTMPTDFGLTWMFVDMSYPSKIKKQSESQNSYSPIATIFGVPQSPQSGDKNAVPKKEPT